jgi:hypothetical protein
MPNRSDWLPGPRADQILTAKDWLLILSRPTPSWRVPSPNGHLDQETLGTKTQCIASLQNPAPLG